MKLPKLPKLPKMRTEFYKEEATGLMIVSLTFLAVLLFVIVMGAFV